MKYIRVSPTVPFVHPVTGKPAKDELGNDELSFAMFVRTRLTDPQFAVDVDALYIAIKIRDALEEQVVKGAGEVLALEDAHYELLEKLVRKPTGGYPGGYAMCFIGHIDAILNATDERPKVEAAA